MPARHAAGLDLYLTNGKPPELNRTTFRHPLLSAERHCVRGREPGAHPDETGSFPWGKVAKALTVFCIRWAAWARQSPNDRSSGEPSFEGERGSLAASLDMALSKKPGWLGDMFGSDQEGEPLLLRCVRRTNPSRKRPGPVAIALEPQELPPNAIRVYVDRKPLEDPAQLERLAALIEGKPCDCTEGIPSPQSGEAIGEIPRVTEALPGEKLIELRLKGNSLTKEDRARLLQGLNEFLEIEGVRIITVRIGSVKVTVAVPAGKAEKLIRGAMAGKLAYLDVVHAAVVNDPQALDLPEQGRQPLPGRGRGAKDRAQDVRSMPTEEVANLGMTLTTQGNVWLQRMLAGDVAARDELLRSMSAQLERLAQKMLRRFGRVSRWIDPEDVCQEAIIRLLRVVEAIRPASVREFLALAALQMRGTLLDLTRHYYRRSQTSDALREPPADLPDSAEPAEELERWSTFHQEVARLPADERELVELLFYHGLTRAGAARILNVPQRTVAKRWNRVVLKLREILKEDFEEP